MGYMKNSTGLPRNQLIRKWTLKNYQMTNKVKTGGSTIKKEITL